MRWPNSLFHKRNRESQLDSELRFHIEQRTAELIAQGIERSEARRRAMVEFGGYESAKEQCREARGIYFLETLLRDVHYSFRTLRKSPGFVAAAVLTLALGIGANTAIFSVTDAVVLHPLPYPHAGRIVEVYRGEGKTSQYNPLFGRDFVRSIRNQIPAIEDLSAYHVFHTSLISPGTPSEVSGVASNAAMFRLLGVHSLLGRGFTAAEGRSGAAPVALISQTLWQDRFSGDPTALGKTVAVAGEPYTIVGVFPAGLRLPDLNGSPQLWVPLRADPSMKSFGPTLINPETISYLNVLGRLKRCASMGQAQAQANTLAARLAKANSHGGKPMLLHVMSLERVVSKNYRAALTVLMAAVGLVLLVACANVANLLLARGAVREREMALRLALGAGRAGIVRQLLVESLELALAGGAAGASIAYIAVNSLAHEIPSSLMPYRGVTVNATTLIFCAVISMAAGILFGFFPALRASDTSVYAAIKQGGRGTAGAGSHGLRQGLVVAEVAMAVVLLSGAGLLLRSLSRLVSTSPGFDSHHVAVASVTLPRSTYRSPNEWRAFISQALDRLRAEPGVSQAAAAVSPPAAAIDISILYSVVGEPSPPSGESRAADIWPVTPGYFSLMRIPLVAGRDFRASDSASSARVCVVDQAVAQTSFAGANPLGHSLDTGGPKPCRIVGVVGNVAQFVGESPMQAIYVPFDQSPLWFMSLLARGQPAAPASMAALRDAIASTDRDLPMKLTTLTQSMGSTAASDRFRTGLVAAFAGIAISVAGVGIFGVIGYSVSRRTQELGVRMALGATPGEILRQVVKEGLRLVVLGCVIGLGGALALIRFMRGLLFHVSPADPLTYLGVALLLLFVAIAACALPALRAARVNPSEALRQE